MAAAAAAAADAAAAAAGDAAAPTLGAVMQGFVAWVSALLEQFPWEMLTLEFWRGLNMAETRHYLLVDMPRFYWDAYWALYRESPYHVIVETALVLVLLWLVIRPTYYPRRGKKKKDDKNALTPAEVEELIAEWNPEPLVAPLSSNEEAMAETMRTVTRVEGAKVYFSPQAGEGEGEEDGGKEDGEELEAVNFASFDFLAISQRQEIKDVSRQALEKYGCGSCGPRGFYGTIDVHLKLEEQIADFMGVQEAISYSDGASTISSALPAFAKRGDLVILDEGAHEPLQTGVTLSRATVRYFKHNDMQDLERVLREVRSEDKRHPRRPLEQRRFILVEGLYRNYGDLCPLDKVVELKNKYRFRLFVDESFSFGVFGANGRGMMEQFRIPVEEATIVTLSLEHSLASVGGVCVGPQAVVDHQRLSGAGYCFSAAAPPFVSVAASEALRIMREEPKVMRALHENTALCVEALDRLHGFVIVSDTRSPIIHLRLSEDFAKLADRSFPTQLAALHAVADRCLKEGVCIVSSKPVHPDKHAASLATIRIVVNAAHTPDDIELLVSAIQRSLVDVLKPNSDDVVSVVGTPDMNGHRNADQDSDGDGDLDAETMSPAKRGSRNTPSSSSSSGTRTRGWSRRARSNHS